MFNNAPAWVRKGARFDLDFVNVRWWGGYVTRGQGTGAADRMKSLLTSGSNNQASVNYSLDRVTGLLVPQVTTASLRIVPGTGIYIEADTSNTCLWSRDLTRSATWVPTNMTTALDQVGMDGVANTASSLTATAANATVIQTLAADASAFRAYSAYIKRITGTGAVSLTLDGGGSWTDISSQINSNTYTRVFITATSANPVVGIRISTSGDAVAVDFNQQENLSATGCPAVPTSPQRTTTAATTRLNSGATEEAFFNTPSTNFNDGIRAVRDLATRTPTSFVVEGAGNAQASFSCLIAGFDVGYLCTGGINGNTFEGASGGVQGINNFNKMAYSRDGTNARGCVNGGTIAVTASPFSTSTAATHGGIGDRGSGDFPINGYITRATFWNRMLSDGEMLEYTR